MSADAASALARLVAALRAEREARERRRAALAAEADALRELHEANVPASTVAHRVARALGMTLTLDARSRLAATLRKRRSRALRAGTDGHGDLAAATPEKPVVVLRSHRASEHGKEEGMSKLVKRTTVTEVFEQDEEHAEEALEASADPDEDEEN